MLKTAWSCLSRRPGCRKARRFGLKSLPRRRRLELIRICFGNGVGAADCPVIEAWTITLTGCVMVTAIDSSILLDVITDSANHADASQAALRKASSDGELIICECVLAEIRPALPPQDVLEFLHDWRLRFIPSSQASALFAGELFFRCICSAVARVAGSLRIF